MEQIFMDNVVETNNKPKKRKKKTEVKNAENILFDQSITACFTGHRPGRGLPLVFFKDEKVFKKLKKEITKGLLEIIKDGYSNFITGMAVGADLMFAETILEMKKDFPHLKLIGAIPCLNQSTGWTEDEITKYNFILEKLDQKFVLSDEYTKDCMLARNRFMVDNSGLVIAMWNRACFGGTFYTIRYAKKQNKEVKIFNMETSEFDTLLQSF